MRLCRISPSRSRCLTPGLSGQCCIVIRPNTALHPHFALRPSALGPRPSAAGARKPILMQSLSIVVMLRLEVVDSCDHSSACQSSLCVQCEGTLDYRPSASRLRNRPTHLIRPHIEPVTRSL